MEVNINNQNHYQILKAKSCMILRPGAHVMKLIISLSIRLNKLECFAALNAIKQFYLSKTKR
jgi:hypothetical protein